MKRFLFALALLCLAPLARAGSYSTHEFNTGFVHVQPGFTGATVPTFDRSLGTLDSMQVVVDRFLVRFNYGVENLGSQSAVVTFGDDQGNPPMLGLAFKPFDGGSVFGVMRGTVPTPTITLAPYDGVLDYNGSSGAQLMSDAVYYNMACPPTSDPATLAQATSSYSEWALRANVFRVWPYPHSSTGQVLNDGYALDGTLACVFHLVYTYH